ncbi:putative LRR receptor-like serine/threonine-protein kinase [Camellia lanceoleosa]|uniref:LRR receptor-like serine/threonine-protein kinase n=1 Tax=Camellia lanceoleosa TaxID=1840588 RepID=A0ACC0GKS5_9ERIC|nr:putative LRR receptor-like serine/threonine-protein kinase [Camellia lanceoleosa]
MGPIPTTIFNISTLQIIAFMQNQFSSELPSSIGVSLPNLEGLYLGENDLSGIVPDSISNASKLVILVLSSNRFNGSTPSSLGNLRLLDYLYLLGNKFTCEYSSFSELNFLASLSSCRQLRKLGPIPQSICSLVDLEFCDLSHNNLSAVTPKLLEELLQLRGEIPSRGSFVNFTYQSFISNEALCGDPQLQVPPCHVDSHLQSRTKQKLLIVYILLLIASILLTMTFVFAFIRCCQRRNENPTQTNLLLAKIRHRRITYHELSRVTDSESNLLGTWSFSSNYKEMFLGKMIFAAKVFKLELDGAFKSFEIECEILCNIRYRNLTKVISNCSTLDIKARSHNCFLDMLQRMGIMIDVACALSIFTMVIQRLVAHCELKPNNVLLDDDMVAHVSNFDIGKLLGVGESIAQTRTIATCGYIAPEYGLEGLVSTKCDVYNYGIMLMEAFTRSKPIDARFDGDLSLPCWVANAVPNAIVQVLDANLLKRDIEPNNARVQCVPSLMQLALNCSADSTKERMIMKDVLVAIKKITLRLTIKLDSMNP